MSQSKFGKVTEIMSLGLRGEAPGRREWLLVECDCGRKFETRANNFRRGLVRSCGCSKKGRPTHRLTGTRVHNIHKGMLSRCNNPNHPAYLHYMGKGIKVCDRWTGKDGLRLFIEDMGMPEDESLTIERIDGSKGYSPDNCRWATRAEQTRNTTQNVILECRGEKLCLSQWASRLGVHRTVIVSRLQRGWSVEKALTTPKMSTWSRKKLLADSEFLKEEA